MLAISEIKLLAANKIQGFVQMERYVIETRNATALEMVPTIAGVMLVGLEMVKFVEPIEIWTVFPIMIWDAVIQDVERCVV